jgi:outer membrane protein
MRFSQSAALAAVLLVGAAATAGAQNPAPDTVAAPGPVLTLEEAQALARRNNPAHQQVVNNRSTAVAGRRAAYASLLPSADASFSTQYRQGGQTVFQGQSFGATSDVRNSSYDIGLNYTLNASKLIAPRVAQATVEAAEADIVGSQETLRAGVTQQYLTVLAAEARAALADTLLANTQVQVELARARAAAGAATQLDVSRAEVAHGQQQVASIQARNTVEIEKLRLFERMGVPQPADVQLSSRFTVTPPAFTLDSVLNLAQRRNPTLEAFRERSKVASLRVRQAQSAYTPSLNVSTGWGGYTSQSTDINSVIAGTQAQFAAQRQGCLDEQQIRAASGLSSNPAACDQYIWSDSYASQIRSENDKYPFAFTKNPWSINASISIPIFNGYQREQNIQEAAAGRADARYEVRAQELRLRAEVTSAYLTMTTAQRTVALQEQNAAAARQQLTLTEERYRVGAATFVDLADARATFERAESERITAIYDFHRAFAALESAVGRPLR